MPAYDICRICKCELTSENWSIGCKKKNDRACRTCRNKIQKKRNRQITEETGLTQYQRYSKKWYLKKRYNITIEQYEKMFEYSKGKCFICGGTNENGRELAVDHCHKTKKVRGLLCLQCNSMLGLSRDSIDILVSAINYLKINGK